MQIIDRVKKIFNFLCTISIKYSLCLALLSTVLRALCNDCDHLTETESSDRNCDVHNNFRVHKQELTTTGDFLSADLEDISRRTPVIKYKTVGNTLILPVKRSYINT
jgi:hypothetical protein